VNESVVSREAHHALGWLHDVFHTPRRRHDHSGADIHLQTGHTVRKTGVRSSLNRTALHGAVQARLRPPTGPSSLRGCGEGRASRLLRASSSSWSRWRLERRGRREDRIFCLCGPHKKRPLAKRSSFFTHRVRLVIFQTIPRELREAGTRPRSPRFK